MNKKGHQRDLTPKGAKTALTKLRKNLPKLSGEEAHDRLVSILVRCMYDHNDQGFLWAHDLPVVRTIINAKPTIKRYAYEWFAGIQEDK